MRVVTVEFKFIKKSFSSDIELPDDAKLDEVNDIFLNHFWRVYHQKFPKAFRHGTIKKIQLTHEDGSIIANDKMLRGAKTIHFFVTQPHEPPRPESLFL